MQNDDEIRRRLPTVGKEVKERLAPWRRTLLDIIERLEKERETPVKDAQGGGLSKEPARDSGS